MELITLRPERRNSQAVSNPRSRCAACLPFPSSRPAAQGRLPLDPTSAYCLRTTMPSASTPRTATSQPTRVARDLGIATPRT